ncbi:MAG: peptidase C1 [Candidatus Krumholzibacteriota bacterium]|nr:peptidase C1 [Candidatus Krumholzibacteriota bacterium]
MKRSVILPITLILIAQAGVMASVARADSKDSVRYEKRYRDPVLKQMIAENDSLKALADSITDEINAGYEKIEKDEKENRKVIRFDFSNVEKPGSVAEFDPLFHFPPVPQYLTGTCWCFCTTSYMESEIARITGRKIKLSELYTVYWEYVEKARGYIAKRGNQPFVEGAESDGVFIIWDKYGIVPAEAYSGLKEYDKHNHGRMLSEMKDYLDMVGEKGYWNEEANITHIRAILDRYLGAPPAEFEFEGKMISPKEFLKQVLKVDSSDYVQFISTLSEPFYETAKFDVHDNWRPTRTYYNLPLDEFYQGIRNSVKNGYTVCIGGDVSEPGYNGPEDACVIPTFDIPWDYIDQDSRELRIFKKTTDDDHGVHLIGFSRKSGKDWFLIKDSARASRHGRFHGYIFYREDYIKLKMLSYTVHKDAVTGLLKKMGKRQE